MRHYTIHCHKYIIAILLQTTKIMASIFHSWSLSFFIVALIPALIGTSIAVYQPSQWSLAHATFYGDETASETMGKSILN